MLWAVGGGGGEVLELLQPAADSANATIAMMRFTRPSIPGEPIGKYSILSLSAWLYEPFTLRSCGDALDDCPLRSDRILRARARADYCAPSIRGRDAIFPVRQYVLQAQAEHGARRFRRV